MPSKTVAVFDILGVKDEIKAGATTALYVEYTNQIELAQLHLKNLGPLDSKRNIFLRVPVKEKYQCSLHIFSDTIILISQGDSFDSFLEVVLTSWRIMQSFLMVGRPIRGAIAYGDMHIDEAAGVFIGSALVDAHELEAAQGWVGASLHPSVVSRFPVSYWRQHDLDVILQALLPEYDVPLKDAASRRLRVLNWRLQYVVKEGLAAVFLRKAGVSSVAELHPYAQEMFRFASAVRGTAYLGGDYPIQMGVHWVGDSEPPWPNGDQY